MTSAPKRDIVVIGASAGGITALKELATLLPADFPASIFIVQHLAPYALSYLPDILNRMGPLPALHPQDGDLIQPGHIYIAPPDHHLLLENDRVLVKKGPKENRFRPSVDALFRSAAYRYGPRVIGIVFTGLLNDGTSGMWSVKRLGGLTIIQDPTEAMYPSMPLSVLEYVDVDHVLSIAETAALLIKLTNEPAPPSTNMSSEEMNRMQMEIKIAAQGNGFDMGILEMGSLTPFTCPECSGTLIRLQEGKLIRYRCHTGHAFTASALLADVSKNVEEMLWKAVRGLEESIMLLEQTAALFHDENDEETAGQFFRKAHDFRSRAEQLHEFIYQQEQVSQESYHTPAPDQ